MNARALVARRARGGEGVLRWHCELIAHVWFEGAGGGQWNGSGCAYGEGLTAEVLNAQQCDESSRKFDANERLVRVVGWRSFFACCGALERSKSKRTNRIAKR